MSITLIHLVSEQPMPNLLPLLALKPERVIQVRSKGTRFEHVPAHVENAAKEAGIHADFRVVVLDHETPAPEEVRYQLKQLLSVFPSAAVNITGGTKLMSLGAYLGAKEFPVPMLYCDTSTGGFQRVGEQKLPAHMLSFQEVSKSLNLRTVMAAHGKSPEAWKFDTASKQQLDFGLTAWKLRNGNAKDFENHQFGRRLRDFFRSDNGKIPKSADKLRSLNAADLTAAIPGELPDGIIRFLESATSAGFLARLAHGGFRMVPGPDQKDKLRSHVERIANLLDGSWLELAVLAFAIRSSRHLDPHWSVEPTTAGAGRAEYGETDLVAINADHSSLEIISCKTSLAQPLEHLEGLRTRANNLGGSHALATLAVLRTDSESKLRQWGKLLRVRVLIGMEIPAHFTTP